MRKRRVEGKAHHSVAFRAEKPEEFADADDAAAKDDESEIDMNRIDEEMFNKVFEPIFEEDRQILLSRFVGGRRGRVRRGRSDSEHGSVDEIGSEVVVGGRGDDERERSSTGVDLGIDDRRHGMEVGGGTNPSPTESDVQGGEQGLASETGTTRQLQNSDRLVAQRRRNDVDEVSHRHRQVSGEDQHTYVRLSSLLSLSLTFGRL